MQNLGRSLKKLRPFFYKNQKTTQKQQLNVDLSLNKW